jgi:hypothetical protein
MLNISQKELPMNTSPKQYFWRGKVIDWKTHMRILMTILGITLTIGGILFYIFLIRPFQLPATSNHCGDHRSLFVRSQNAKITLDIDRATATWTYGGKPAAVPTTEDEVFDNMLQTLRFYEMYGVYDVQPTDEIMGRIEYAIWLATRTDFAPDKTWSRTNPITDDMREHACVAYH